MTASGEHSRGEEGAHIDNEAIRIQGTNFKAREFPYMGMSGTLPAAESTGQQTGREN